MKVWIESKGNRIRASDKSLVYYFCIGWLLLLFVAVFLLLNLRQLLVTDWTDFNLLHVGITWTAYNSITVLITTGVCALVAFLYYRYWYDRIKRLLHRQKLARMMLENKWYDADTIQDSVFFTDLQSRSREKFVWLCRFFNRNNSQSLTPWLNIDYNIATRKELIVWRLFQCMIWKIQLK